MHADGAACSAVDRPKRGNRNEEIAIPSARRGCRGEMPLPRRPLERSWPEAPLFLAAQRRGAGGREGEAKGSAHAIHDRGQLVAFAAERRELVAQGSARV